MQTIAEYMSADHPAGDEAFANAEHAVLANNWSDAETAFDKFRTGLARHFRMEEEELFPALVSAGGPGGPVQMMRMEHAQMTTLVEQMATTLAFPYARGDGGFLGASCFCAGATT